MYNYLDKNIFTRGQRKMEYVILILSTLAVSGKAIFCKLAGSVKGRGAFFVNFKAFLTAFAVMSLIAIRDLPGIFNISLYSLILAVVYGISVGFTQFTQMKAMNAGPASITTFVYSSSLLIPIVYSYFVWSEPISVWQIIGIAILFISLLLIVIEPGEKKINTVWILFISLAALGSGANGIIQKAHQLSAHKSELNLFLIIAFLFAAIASLIIYFLYRPEEVVKKDIKKPSVMSRLFPILLGITVGGLNFLNLTLAGLLPAAIIYPVTNIGSLILTSVISVIAFKERLGIRRIIGYVIGIFAILIIGML